MNDREKVVGHLYDCLLSSKPENMWVFVRKDIVGDALALLKAQEARHRLEVHNIGNVDIPEGVTWEQFQAVMSNVVDALEHTDRGESWPYEDAERMREG